MIAKRTFVCTVNALMESLSSGGCEILVLYVFSFPLETYCSKGFFHYITVLITTGCIFRTDNADKSSSGYLISIKSPIAITE